MIMPRLPMSAHHRLAHVLSRKLSLNDARAILQQHGVSQGAVVLSEFTDRSAGDSREVRILRQRHLGTGPVQANGVQHEWRISADWSTGQSLSDQTATLAFRIVGKRAWQPVE